VEQLIDNVLVLLEYDQKMLQYTIYVVVLELLLKLHLLLEAFGLGNVPEKMVEVLQFVLHQE
jgi:hypothetical protein